MKSGVIPMSPGKWQRAKAMLFTANSVALARCKFEKHVNAVISSFFLINS